MPPSLSDQLRRCIDAVEERIRAACDRAGRPRSSVTLVAVTKTAPEPVLPLLPALGLTHLAESRPQQLWRRAPLAPASWHLVGHLQRNKVERTLPLVALIHSVDSDRLLRALEAEAAKQSRRADVLLEVKTSAEESKLGLSADEVRALVPVLEELQRVRVSGLMTMAPLEEPERCRESFAALRRLRDEIRPQLRGHDLAELSMGMSNDFETAIEEGATLVRVGSALFEGLESRL
jgi:PLP dependent protein